jgi:FtsH-binding integral membrane protein
MRSLHAVSKRGDMLLLVSSAFAAVAPKCPLCLFALMGATGAAGTAAAVWMPALMVASLLLAVGAMWMRSRAERRIAPAAIALVLALAILAGKFLFASAAVVYAGAAALFVLAIANFARQRMQRRTLVTR